MHLILDTFSEDAISVRQAIFSMSALRLLKDLPGARWSAPHQVWVYPVEHALDVVRGLEGAQLAITPRAREVLKKQHDGRPRPTPVAVLDYLFKTTPYQHQIDAFQAARTAKDGGRYEHALLMEMGTGKTKTAIDTVSWWKQVGNVRRVLVLVPKALLFSWEREFETHSPLPARERVVRVVTGTSQQKSKLLEVASETNCFGLVTNYHTLLSHEEELVKWALSAPTAVVLDEATAIKNPNGKIAKASERLGEVSRARLILTGTPVTQSPLDLYSLFRFLNPAILGHKRFTSFRAEYAISVKLNGIPVPVVKGYRNLDRLNKLIQPYSSRVLKADCLDLPEKVYKTVELPMGPKQADLYRRMRDEAVVDVDPSHPPLAAPVVLTRLLRLQQITSGFLPVIDEFGTEVECRPIEDSPKMAAVVDLIEEVLESKQKAIIWCRFTWEVLSLRDKVGAIPGAKVVLYHGETSAEDRQKNVDAIQTGDANVFIGQIQTGGMGITLTAVRTVIYYSNTFSLSDRLQSEDRAHRIGQTASVLYIDLVHPKTIDTLIRTAHLNKKDLADMVTGDNLRQLLGE